MFWLSVFDIIGTVAFAISGALVGMRKQLDFFGVITLAITTASFGGISRDVFVGNLPPTFFRDPKYFTISIITATLTFIVYPRLMKLLLIPVHKYRLNIILILDAIGLGAFTALGARIAMTHNLNNLFSVIFMGLITGVGGGVLRDVFVRDIPLILRKDIYASASIAGSFIMYYSIGYVSELTSLYLCFGITTVLRLLSIQFNINLPVAHIATND